MRIWPPQIAGEGLYNQLSTFGEGYVLWQGGQSSLAQVSHPQASITIMTCLDI